MLRIGVISAYPREDWHAQRIASAAARRHQVDVLAPTDFAAQLRSGAPRVQARGRDVRELDLILTPRALGDEGDPDVQLELYRLAAATGVPMCNHVDALLAALDKLRTSWELARAGLPTPEARLVQSETELEAALAQLGTVVVKPVYGSLGQGIERLTRGDVSSARELLARRGALYLQRYVGDARLDVRAFVVGDAVVAAVARKPEPGEFRANAHLGSHAVPVELDAASAEAAVRATKILGLTYSGVDLLVGPRGPELLEVNGTPAWRGILEATGRDMAEVIVDEATRGLELRRTG